MKFVYDYAVAPPTFDVVAALLLAESQRLQRGEDYILWQFAPGPVGGFRSDRLWPQDVAERRRMHDGIVLPMVRMLPSVKSVEWFGAGAGVRTHGLDIMVRSMAAAGRPLRPLGGPSARDERLVTITLRECEHWPKRNSNVPQWMVAADAIERIGYRVVFIRDTAKADEGFAGFATDQLAARNLDHRAALYRNAVCNLFVSNGPAWFALALDAPVLMLKPVTEKLGRCYCAEYFRSCGLPPGSQLPGNPAHQRIVWADDTEENIVGAFEEFRAAAQARAA